MKYHNMQNSGGKGCKEKAAKRLSVTKRKQDSCGERFGRRKKAAIRTVKKAAKKKLENSCG